MYSKDIPYNDLPPLPPDINYDEVDILKAVNTANIALSELKGAATFMPNQEILLAPLILREAVASNEIENIHTTVIDLLKAEVLSETEIRLPEKETFYYRDALQVGLKAIRENRKLTYEDIIQIQSIIEPETKGLRQPMPDKVVRIKNIATDTTVYTQPDSVAVLENLLRNLETYYNDTDDKIDPIIKAAISHYQFEAIHPFADGNGRTGRVLIVLYFVLHGRLDLPLLFISQYLLANRSEYYRLLGTVTKENNWSEWLLFMLKGIEEQALLTRDTVVAVKALIDEYKMTAEKQNLPRDAVFVDYLFANAFYTYSHLGKTLSVHRNTAASYLKKLERAGVLKSMTVKKELVFYHTKLVDILSQ